MLAKTINEERDVRLDTLEPLPDTRYTFIDRKLHPRGVLIS